jgi:hypothetical protein
MAGGMKMYGKHRFPLENNGYAVLDTGMSRSPLAGKRLKQAKEGHLSVE